LLQGSKKDKRQKEKVWHQNPLPGEPVPLCGKQGWVNIINIFIVTLVIT
jgi:hypothetical protein